MRRWKPLAGFSTIFLGYLFSFVLKLRNLFLHFTTTIIIIIITITIIINFFFPFLGWEFMYVFTRMRLNKMQYRRI